MHGGGMMMGGPMMVVSVLIMVVVVVAVIAGAVWLVRALPLQRAGPRREALDELELRYARGEIERDEYLQRRHDLGRPDPDPRPSPRGDG